MTYSQHLISATTQVSSAPWLLSAEKKREARRRAQRQRAWTAGLLGGAAALCIVGGAVYGAYWYWEGDWPFLGAGSAEKSSTSDASLSVVGQGEGGSSRVDSIQS